VRNNLNHGLGREQKKNPGLASGGGGVGVLGRQMGQGKVAPTLKGDCI